MRLLTLPPDEIASLVESYEKDVKTIKTESLKMTWFMRGGVTYNEVMQMSSDERSAINQIIKENLETTKKSKLLNQLLFGLIWNEAPLSVIIVLSFPL